MAQLFSTRIIGIRELIRKTATLSQQSGFRRVTDAAIGVPNDRFADDLRRQMRARLRSSSRIANQVRATGDRVVVPDGAAEIINRLEFGGRRTAGQGGPILEGPLAKAGRVGSVAAIVAGGRGRFVATMGTRYGPRRAVWERSPGGSLRALIVFGRSAVYDRKLNLSRLRDQAAARSERLAARQIERML